MNSDGTEDVMTPDSLKQALKTFRKRLRLTRLDAESKLGGGALSGGKNSGIVAIRPPNSYPQEVWEELVKLGKLRYEGGRPLRTNRGRQSHLITGMSLFIESEEGVKLQTNTPLHQESKWFSERWNVYKNLIGNNYLYHYDIHSCLHEMLAGYFIQKPLSLLDLGCGDASFIASTLKGTTISRYYGIDLSEVALKEAVRNLAGSDFESTLLCGNAAESIVGLQEGFDAIVCGYSLHHLTVQEKDAVFSNCRRILSEGGLFLIYDIVRKRNESRDEYLNRYWDISERCWTNISKDETAILKAHAMESDFPDDVDYFPNQSRKYGFKRVEIPYQDVHKTVALMCLYG